MGYYFIGHGPIGHPAEAMVSTGVQLRQLDKSRTSQANKNTKKGSKENVSEGSYAKPKLYI